MTKKQKFLLEHTKIGMVHGYIVMYIHKIQGIGKSDNCYMCEICKNKGCIKHRIAKKFKLARSLEAKCFEYNNNATTEQ